MEIKNFLIKQRQQNRINLETSLQRLPISTVALDIAVDIFNVFVL